MSGFEYYEFMAVDRPLSPQEEEEVGKLSSRARVSSNRAISTYNYGSFRGNSDEVLRKYFDAFLYISNYGTKKLGFRLPTRLLKSQSLCPYEYEYIVEIEPYEDVSLVLLNLNDEEGGGWIEEEDCVSLLDALLPLRQDLLLGDPRALYLALIAGQDRIEEETYIDTLPVPPNLKSLTPALQTLVEFFEISPDRLKQAIAASPDIAPEPFDLTHLGEQEKDIFLQRVLENDPHVRIDLQNLLAEKRVKR